MSRRSIIPRDVKGECGGISRKGFEVRFGRSWSRRMVQDSFVEQVDLLRQGCWANMPPELLRDVLKRIEASESTWPPRKSVVSCAGVCRSWREIMKETVKPPDVCGRLTFPISLKQPGPRDTLCQCFIKRNRSSQTYHLYLNFSEASNDDGKFLLAAQKCRRTTCTEYIISLNPENISKGRRSYIGKLRSNFLGTKFVIYDAQPPSEVKFTKSHSTKLVGTKQISPSIPSGNYPVAHISYESNVLGSRGPRRMQCIMDGIPASSVEPGGVAPTQTEFLPVSIDSFPSFPFFRSKSKCADSIQSETLTAQKDDVLTMRNKAPGWHEQLQCWCLNFHGRVTVASVKNFQLVASSMGNEGRVGHERESVILQFGKVGKDVYTMDYQYPISAFQAFAICLSSFDTKIARE
ncbi:unnamed protein product [Cuscuta epithymum]|uniref:Tubby-like F-box protein 3 n=1 Tax=Cuscuta epithymum TaxID=186058 RepID=A0AAV0E2A9_9ASTE|nr:unnamed protein product [Cuscuta epithymum]CAH9132665.1 unnamed protein product [Cuscuta epithymum]